MTEPENSATRANDELWLTYLNYDRAVQQAVNRLSALSSDNVDVFRSLLLAGRDRSRVKEYEAESIRRLQGELFVGDDELQRALVVLNAEDAHLGDALKRLVATAGRPTDLDQAVAAIQSRQTPSFAPAPEKVEAPILTPAAAPQPEPPEPVSFPRNPAQASVEEPPQPAPTPLPEPVPMPVQEPAQASIAEVSAHKEVPTQTSRTKRLIMFGAVFLVAATGLVLVASRFGSGDASKVASTPVTAPPLRPAAQDSQTASANPAAQHPPVATASPGQAGKPSPTPVVAPAEVPPADTATTPVPGSHYKVVRGDMLSEIARRAYKDASKFRLIQQANPNLRNGPNRIYYDQVIFIPPAP